MNWAIRFKVGTEMAYGPPSVWNIKRPLSGCGLICTWPNFEILGPPNNFWTKRAICFKFGSVTGVTWPNFQILGPLIYNNFWTNWAVLYNFGTEVEDGTLLCTNIKRPLSGRGLVTWPNFQILGPAYNFWTNRAIRVKFSILIKDRPFLRTDHKLSCAGGSWLVFPMTLAKQQT